MATSDLAPDDIETDNVLISQLCRMKGRLCASLRDLERVFIPENTGDNMNANGPIKS